MTTKTESSKKFSWTDDNYAKVRDSYLAKLESDGVEVASGNDYLLELAKMVGAASEKAVRGKLSREGDYVKLDKPASQAKTNKVRKEHYVRAIAHTFGRDADDLDSLKNAKQDHLATIAELMGIDNVLESSATNYQVPLEQVIARLIKSHDIDIEIIEDEYMTMYGQETETKAE